MPQIVAINPKKVVPEMGIDDSMKALVEQNQTFSDGNQHSEKSQHSIVDEELDTEGMIEQQKIEEEKERQRILAEKREKEFQKKKNRVMCCQRFCCFKDEEKQFNLTDRLPSITQVMCWRFFKARRSAIKYHMESTTLESLEKSSC